MSVVCEFFESIDDPRAGNSRYRLGDLLVMMVAASLCGATTATEFSLFAQTRSAVLRKLVNYKRAPSHDTFSRLLRLLDPQAFASVFSAFSAAFAQALKQSGISLGAEVVAIDGKALRRAYERGLSHAPPLVVSAFAADARLCLAAAPAGEDNEVETALRVIDLLDLTGKIVTADALHCHRRMADAVTGRKGGYVLALKANRHDWLAEAERCFERGKGISSAASSGLAHGRSESRTAELVAAREPRMASHAAYVRLTSIRDGEGAFTRYYMASKGITAAQALDIVRSHWLIENTLHWILDVHLREDDVRARKDNAPANIALLKRLARNILQTADEPKVPISHRIKKCAWNDAYLLNAVTHMR